MWIDSLVSQQQLAPLV